MADRRPLIEGLKSTPQAPSVDPARELEFVHGKKIPAMPPPATAPVPVQNINRTFISTRIRTNLFNALKRASLERELQGVAPHLLQDILDQALESWLNSNGYLR